MKGTFKIKDRKVRISSERRFIVLRPFREDTFAIVYRTDVLGRAIAKQGHNDYVLDTWTSGYLPTDRVRSADPSRAGL